VGYPREVFFGLYNSSFLSTVTFDGITKSSLSRLNYLQNVYADDLKAYVGIGDEQNGLDIFSTNLLSIEDWLCSTWILSISGSKSYHTHINL